MVARFSECAVVSNWLPHTPVQIFFHLILVQKTIWCSLSSLSTQARFLVVTFRITIFSRKINCHMTQAIVYMCFTRRGFKKKVPQQLKIFLAHFDHYNLINKEESTVQIWYGITISS